MNAIATKYCIYNLKFRHFDLVSSSGVILYTLQHDVICLKDANIHVANSYSHPD